MTAADLLERARADGVVLALDPAGKLKASGEQAAVARWIPAVRAHKAAIVAALVAVDPEVPAGSVESPQADTESDEPRRMWLVTLTPSERFSASYSPPATLREVRSWHPAALAIEREDEPDPELRLAVAP
jgi:hypothetical protein